MTVSTQLPLALKLRSGSSLESFVAGNNQHLVTQLSVLGQDEPGQLYIWGEEGSGRSHLLEAKVKADGARACFLSATELAGLSPGVLEGLERFALVAIDDIDHLAGQRDWEEALFHLYNRLRQAGSSMLFSAATAPTGAKFELPDLSSRLAAGPVWQLLSLDEAGLEALLQRRGSALGVDISEDVARYLVARTPRTATAVTALLDELDRQAMARQRRLTIPFIRSLTTDGAGLTKL
jgi:DnaA-homolog protein